MHYKLTPKSSLALAVVSYAHVVGGLDQFSFEFHPKIFCFLVSDIRMSCFQLKILTFFNTAY